MAVDLGICLFTSAGILLFLAILATALRCVARTYIVKAFGLDDWLMIITVILFAHYCSWSFYGRSLNQGNPTDKIPLSDLAPALKAFYFTESSYIISTCTLKLSIGTFLLRIVQSKIQRYSIYLTMLIVTSFCTSFFFTALFQCTPIDKFWNPSPLVSGKCLSPTIVLNMCYAHSAIIIFSDFFFAILPIFVIWDLQMDRFTKFSVCGLLSLGTLAGATSIARVPYINALADESNIFQATAKLAILTAVEPGLGIIIGSVAATRPLFKAILSKYHIHMSISSPTTRKISRPFQMTGTPTTCARHSTFARRADAIDTQKVDASREGFSTVTVTAGKMLCYKCVVDEEMAKSCGNCDSGLEMRSLRHGRGPGLEGSESQEHLNWESDSVIYKEVEINRVVEFLGK